MTKKFAIIVEKGRGHYTAYVAGLACCYAKGKTFNALIKNAQKSIKRYLKNEDDAPESDFVGVRILELHARSPMKFTVVIEKGEKYYIAYVPSMSGCHTQAPTIKKLMEYIKEAAVLHLSLYKNNKKSDFVGFRLLEV